MALSSTPTATEIQDLARSMNALTTDLLIGRQTMNDFVKLTGAYLEETKLISEEATEQKAAMKDVVDLASRLGTVYLKQEQVQRRINENTARTAIIQDRIVAAQADMQNLINNNNALEYEKIDTLAVQLVFLQKQIVAEQIIADKTKEIYDNINAANAAVFEMENNMGLVGKLFKTISETGFLKNLINSNKILKDIEKSAKAGGTRMEMMKAGAKSFGEELKRVATDPVSLLTAGMLITQKILSTFYDLVKKAFTAVLEMSKGVTQLGNNMALSKEAAQGMYSVFRGISEEGKVLNGSLDSAFLSITNQSDALIGLQQAFGTSAMLSDEMLQNQILLTKQMGMEADEAAGIQKLGMLNKQSAESILNSAVKNNTASISYRKIISEIAKVNAEISAAYKNNPDLLAKAVVQASKLGMTLEETRKVADSLLDFESSISNELEAELLTGKQLNFEKARALALDGKSAEAAAELMKQMGGINGLTQLNVIQRAAMAKSIGMTSEELTKAAQQQEILNALGVDNTKQLQNRYDQLISMNKTTEAAALLDDIRKQKNGDMMAQDISRASLSQRFEESMTRIKEIFVNIASGPITTILESFAKLLQHTTLIKVLMVSLATVAAAFAASMVTAAIASVITTGGASLAAAAIVGGATLLAGTALAVSDSAISPSGQVMISTPKGMIKPDPNDSIITTTNPQALLGGNGSGAGVENKLDTMITLMSKGGNVFIDSVRAGTAQGMSYNSYA